MLGPVWRTFERLIHKDKNQDSFPARQLFVLGKSAIPPDYPQALRACCSSVVRGRARADHSFIPQPYVESASQ